MKVKTRETLGKSDTIYFYTDLGIPEFCNYHVHKKPLIIREKEYKSVEHFFQSYKFVYKSTSPQSLEYAEIVRNARTPNIARELAWMKIKSGWSWRVALNPTIQKYRDLGVTINPYWDAIKENIMREGLFAKFTQDKECMKILLKTKDRVIIEHTSRDSYWGDAGNGSGKNRLGLLLMELRIYLRMDK